MRLSGPDAIALAATLVGDPAALEGQPSHTLRHVRLHDGDTGAPLDEAMVAVMRSPRSYTGEDVVELSCHGSPAVLAMVTERLRRAGARLAAPGEFTRRAFLNGRIDLARAEAVALLIGARSERAALLAARALAGDLGARIQRVRETLLDVVAGLEVSLDFPDEEVGLAVERGAVTIETLIADVDDTLAAARRGRLVHDGLSVAIVGRPNAGKSSLLNALVGHDRAIVATTPGTTRDVIEAGLVVAGVAVRLLDTAGLGTTADPVEAEGMRRSLRAIEQSDLVLLVVDGSVGASREPLPATAHRRVIAVRSKADLPLHPDAVVHENAVDVSSVTGAGIPALLDRLASEVATAIGGEGDESQLAVSLRQLERLEEIGHALRSGRLALGALPLEVALVDLREALVGASDLLGIELGDTVLDRVFATFCVGK